MPVIYVRDPESGQFIPIPTLKGDKGEKAILERQLLFRWVRLVLERLAVRLLLQTLGLLKRLCLILLSLVAIKA